jgi:hypothetical protein
MQRLTRLAIISLAALALSGCVAAALPALAGGTMMRSQSSRDAPATIEPASEAVATPPAPTMAQPATPPAVPSSEPGALELGAEEFSSFVSFARLRSTSVQRGDTNLSATLLNPGMLDGERARCGDLPPAVLIDLDRGEESFVPLDAYQSPPAFAAGLESLRANGIVVSWISAANIDQLGAIRYALSQAGLDPEGNDQLLLRQHSDERKQTRREEFSKSHCIIAIAGDTLADFDELFLFLTNPDAAKPVHALIGDGWFITPLALTKQ